MIAVPEATPVTPPSPETVATALLLLLQIPPTTSGVSVFVCPIQTIGIPVMEEAAVLFTVSTAVALQPPLL
jgi:hypothetical protein